MIHDPMLRGLVWFEWRQQRRQIAFWGMLLLLPALSLAMVATGFGPDNTALNSPFVVVQSVSFLSLTTVFAITIFTASGALRDSEHGMTELIRSTSAKRLTIVAARFIGVSLAGCAVMALGILTLAVAPYFVGSDTERVGPLQPIAYVYAFLMVAVPNVLLTTSVLLLIAIVTQKALPTYVGGVALYAMYFVVAMAIDSPLFAGSAPQSATTLARSALLDPFGISSFFAETRFWTPADRNQRMLPLWGHMLNNRLLWLGVTGGFLFAVAWIKPRESYLRRSRNTRLSLGETTIASYVPTAVSQRHFSFELLMSALRLELRGLLCTWSFAVLMLLWVMYVGIELTSNIGRDEFGTRLIPATMLILRRIGEPLSLFCMAALIYFAAEVVWRERSNKVSELVDATAGPRSVLVFAKAIALVAIVLLLSAIGISVGIGYQLMRGYTRFEVAGYSLLFLRPGIALIHFAVLAMLLQVLSPNRYVGMLLSVVALFLLQSRPSDWLSHPLFRYSVAPAFSWSDIAGCSAAWPSFLLFSGYWSIAAAILFLATPGMWARGRDVGFIRRLKRFAGSLGFHGRCWMVASIVSFLALGSFLATQTLLGDRFETRVERETWRAGYERSYDPLKTSSKPTLRGVRTSIRIVPDQRRWEATGELQLINETTESIDTLWVSVPHGVEVRQLNVAGANRDVSDRKFEMYSFQLGHRLAPGDSIELQFSFASQPRSLRVNHFNESVVSNGTFLISTDVLPMLGYRNRYALVDPRTRLRHGLSVVSTPTGAMENDSGDDIAAAMVDVEITTAPDQLAHTTGRLIAQSPGRFHYRTDTPIRPYFAVTSSRSVELSSLVNGTEVTFAYDAKHTSNAPAVVEAASSSLDLFNQEFGSYSADTLRIVEVPATDRFAAFALPGVIYLNEARGMLTDLEDGTRVDLITRRIAHEVSHQWWGHRLAPANGPGASMLVECIAKYSEQLAIKRKHGPLAVAELVAFDEARYFGSRSNLVEGEPALTKVLPHQAFLYYGKGSVVLHSTAELLGEAKLHKALQRLLEKNDREPIPPNAESFVELLREAAADAPRSLERIEEDYHAIASFDYAIDSAWSEPSSDGGFDVVLQMSASKWLMEDGQENETPLSGSLTIAILNSDPRLPLTRAEISKVETREITSGKQEFRFKVPQQPTGIVLDPYVTYLDRDRGNNWRDVSSARVP